MSTIQICRTCLATDTRMYTIANTPLQLFYEKVTNLTLKTQHDRQSVVCYICYHLLKKCQKFADSAVRADKVLQHIYTSGIQITKQFVGSFEQRHLFTYYKTPVTHVNFEKKVNEDINLPNTINESIKIKVEIEEEETAVDATKFSEDKILEDPTQINSTDPLQCIGIKKENEAFGQESFPENSGQGIGALDTFECPEDYFQEYGMHYELKKEREDETLSDINHSSDSDDSIPVQNEADREESDRELVGENIEGGPAPKKRKSSKTVQGQPSSKKKTATEPKGAPGPKKRKMKQTIESSSETLEVQSSAKENTVTDKITDNGTILSKEINNDVFEEKVKEWLGLIGSDDESEDTTDTILPLTTERNASAEPATVEDQDLMTQNILDNEDRLNDSAMRTFAPNENHNFDWSCDRQTFTGQREQFTQPTGPTFPVTYKTRATDIFYKMIDSDFVDQLCIETNRYASQKIAALQQQGKLLPNSRLHRWTPTDRDEMISFLSLTILQGLYPLPEEESYFSYNGYGTMPYFRKIMSYNRYLLLKSFLHFTDNSTVTEKTKICKIQPIIDYFNRKFSELYDLDQDIVIDESLLKWHGSLSFTQKVQSKATQLGIKTYELCESSSGYLYKLFVYAGKNKQKTAQEDRRDETERLNEKDKQKIQTDRKGNERDRQKDEADRQDTKEQMRSGPTAKIVYDLVHPLLNRGHTLILDNFYNCPLLARCLKRQKTDCYGTLRLNRKFVPDTMKTLKKTKLGQGEMVTSYCSDLSMMVWRDANLVSMISTYHHLQIETRQRYNKLTCIPNIVLDYNKSMGGVDRKHQFLTAHPLERLRLYIWYKKLFHRIFNAAIFNSFLIFQTGHKTVNQRQFRTMLAEDLLKIHQKIDLTTEPRYITQRHKQTVRKRTQSTSKDRPRLQHRHFPVKTGFKQSRCWLCTQNKITSRTVWKCLECDINLCVEGCFMQYHIA